MNQTREFKWAWDRYERWFHMQNSGEIEGIELDGGDLVSYRRLRDSWIAGGGWSDHDDGGIDGMRRDSESPLDWFFTCIAMGILPAPATLWTLLDCWARYIDGEGDLSLEAAFFGPPAPRVGNHAGREALVIKELTTEVVFGQEMCRHKNLKLAAEAASIRLGGKPDADSILRKYRGINVQALIESLEASASRPE